MNTTLFRPLIFHSSVPENACRIPKDNFHRLQPNMTPLNKNIKWFPGNYPRVLIYPQGYEGEREKSLGGNEECIHFKFSSKFLGLFIS